MRMDTNTRTDEPTAKPSLRVVEAVADADGVDPVRLDPPLHSAIDPEALDRLFEPTPTGPRAGTVRFSYRDHDVTVHPDGTVDVS